jgi:methionyl-tRNA synthetase
VLAADFDDLATEVSGLLDHAEITQALERIWQRVRRLNRYVEERAPWQLAKDPASTQELDVTLRSLAEGLRAVTVLLWPYIPATSERLLQALGAPDTAIETAAYGARPGGAGVEKLPPLFPKPQ